MAPIIRRARPEDAEAIAALVDSLVDYFLADPSHRDSAATFFTTITPAAFRERLEGSDFRYHLAEATVSDSDSDSDSVSDSDSHDDPVLAGVVAVRGDSHLYHLFVAEDFHRQGLAARLWATARAAAEAAGNPGRFTVNSSLYARPVYERFGFRATSDTVHKDGLAFVPMMLDASPDGMTEPAWAYRVRADQLEAALEEILAAPGEVGTVEMIVRRPAIDQREVLEQASLDVAEGLVGDNWRTRGSSKTADGTSHPEMQINVMNARVIAHVAGTRERWPLAGDQLYVDLDLGPDNLPPGTRLAVGTATLEVTAMPHLGCKKFVERFGLDAMEFVNSMRGKRLRLRGLNARVVEPGCVRPGDAIRKLPG